MNDLMLNTPGVKIDERNAFPASIEGVSTSIPLFIGPTANDQDANGDSLIGTPRRITTIREFEELYGIPEAAEFDLIVNKFLDVQGALDRVEVSYAMPNDESVARRPQQAILLYQALRWYFDNGGGPCHVIAINSDGVTLNAAYAAAIAEAEKEPEITIIVLLNTTGADLIAYGGFIGDALDSCAKLKDRFAVGDFPDSGPDGDFTGNPALQALRNAIPAVAEELLKYGAIYGPECLTTYGVHYSRDHVTIAASSERRQAQDDGSFDTSPLFPSQGDPNTGTDVTFDSDAMQGVENPQGDDPIGEKAVAAAVQDFLEKSFVIMPPSPAIAGIYARVDRQRGVHVAPANVAVKRIVGPALTITEEEHGRLNVDPNSGKSINAIRSFPGRGHLVYGARTLAGNSLDWKFVPKRRMAIYLETSIKLALTRYVFAPNVTATWVLVKTMIEGFLTTEWRAGRLAGPTTEAAFDVTIGLGTTMTQQDILEGRMNVEVRCALVAPAEVIVLVFSQKLQTA